MSVSKTFALNSLLQIREHRLDIDKVNLSSDKNQTNFSICRVSLFHLAAIRSLNGTEIKKKGFFLFHFISLSNETNDVFVTKTLIICSLNQYQALHSIIQ